MSQIERQISENLAEVHARIASACARSGRIVDAVTLVAVTKYADWPWVETLVSLGIRDLGESRPQQLLDRAEKLDPSQNIHWHLIGHLQRNKVRPILGKVFRFHSVDTFKLLDRMQLLAAEVHVSPHALLEVHLSGEATKDGFAITELESQWKSLLKLSPIQITGLMTMAPDTEDEDIIRGVFRSLRQLRDRLETLSEGKLHLPELSMGMSHDYEIAIEEGATLIRLGSRLFAGLKPSSP